MKMTTLALLGTLVAPFSQAYAQGQTTPVMPAATATGVIPAQGTTVNPGTIPTQGLTVDPSVTPTDVQGAREAQSAQQNAVQANPAQSPQQAGAGGIFGPSKGPGIFGPAGQTVTTDIYGNQQVTPGQAAQPNTQVAPGSGAVRQGARTTQSNRPGQTPLTPTIDSNANPIPTDGQVQNQLPRDLQPLTTPSTQPMNQAQPAGTVTGR